MSDLPRTTILLVDDHFFVREGLATSLSAEAEFHIVGEAASVKSACELIRELKPDLVLLDGELVDGHGREVLKMIIEEGLPSKVLLFSVDIAEESVAKAIDEGARGYLAKTSPRKELIAAIHKVMEGAIYLPHALEQLLIERNKQPQLTNRELAVLKRVAAGDPNKLIAADLGISETTVKVHLSHVFEKFGVQDRTSATTVALQKGLVTLV